MSNEIWVVVEACDEPSLGPDFVCIPYDVTNHWRRITIEVRRRQGAVPVHISLDDLLKHGQLSPDGQAWRVPIGRFGGAHDDRSTP